MFSEWLDQSLVMDQSPQKSSYVQDLVVPEKREFIGTYSENNSLDDFVQNSDFLLDEISEIEFCSSFSDNFLFDGPINEQRSM